ncbi:MAG: PIG-L family deacetylase [Chloroflexi bacterium]|nr:PIG-L family deacetylase [Chloroflexota bacterium]
MSIHAHPDDQEFTVAGMLARWAQNGCQVVSVIVTSGEAGSNDPSKNADYKPELASLREAEQSAANAVLGITETVFLRYPDGALEPTLDLRRDLTRLVRRCRPEAVVIGDPQGVFYGNGYINHPDHRAAAQAGLYAAFPSAGTRLIFTELLAEGLEPHDVKRVYVHGAEKSDTWVDITGTIDVKIAALRKHASQLGDWDPEKMIREWAAEEGKEHEMEYAEAYKVMVLSEDEDHG